MLAELKMVVAAVGARRLKLAVRPQDQVMRLAGDEFEVLVEDVPGPAKVAQVAQRIVQAFRLAVGPASVGTSIGSACYGRAFLARRAVFLMC